MAMTEQVSEVANLRMQLAAAPQEALFYKSLYTEAWKELQESLEELKSVHEFSAE